MDNEEFLNSLRQVNTLIDVQLSRLDSVERNNPKQAVYLQQIHNALIKSEESCDSCFVLPSTSTGTGGGNGGGGGLPPEYTWEGCGAENIMPIVLKNSFYNYTDSNIVCLAYRVIDLSTDDIVLTSNIEVSAEYLRDGDLYYAPSVSGMDTENNITSTFYQPSRLFENLIYELSPYLDCLTAGTSLTQVGQKIKRTYIGLNQHFTGLSYGQVNKIRLHEVDYSSGETLDSFGGTFTFVPNDITHAQNLVYAHFTPLLEAAGYVVEEYNYFGGGTNLPFMPDKCLKLTKTTAVDIVLYINFTMVQPLDINVAWDATWTDYNVVYGNFKDMTLLGQIKTEEDYKDEFTLTLKPKSGADYGVNPNIQQVSHRIELLSYSAAGFSLPPNGIDWLVVNRQGIKATIDSCYIEYSGEY